MSNTDKKTPKSETTRQAILEAAQRQFYEKGYDGASVRRIAQAVPIDPAMIMRYFGSKEGLFSAAVVIDLKLPDPEKIPHDRAGAALVAHFLNLWEGERSAIGLPILLRSAVSNQDAADKIRAVFEKQVAPTIAGLTRTDDADIRAGLIVSQLFGLALCRYILKLPPVVDMTADEIITRIGPIIQRHLGGSA
ncbi:TetR/AcrR family transcriptional regulator [Roseovarius sp. TE539]|uniref:TetR/AcrR family transcriptional regulator n=1 Tax=Roseovarius sp. TE539 TaxID=2249812 RepID=UPI000DDFA179|nr:TetR family transcriptional regulator [Roseovarius sp. TE539]RBI71235.1 TetR/AcrR family transcriptional regulator [Roseovarius sp. TE539]